MSDTYTLGSVKIGTDVIKQITNVSISQGLRTLLARGSGALYPSFAAIGSYEPFISFSSTAPKLGLTAIGLAGVKLSTSNAILYFQQTSELGRVAAGCRIITIAKGVAVWRSMSAPHLSQAGGVWEIWPASADGAASPYAEDTGQTMAADVASELYVGGDGSGADLIQGWELDTGIVVNRDYGDGQPWPQNVWQGNHGPVVATANMLKAQNLGDKAMTALKLLNNTEGAARGGTDITFTFNEELSHVDGISGAGPLGYQLRIMATYDGINLPVAVTGI